MSNSDKDALEVLHVVGGTSQEGGVMAFAKTVATNSTPGIVHRIWKHRDYQPPKDTANLWACAGRASKTDVSLASDILGAMRDLPHLVKWVRHHSRVVLHAHSRLGNIAAAIAARITNTPVIAHAHAMPRHTALYHRLWRFSRAKPVFNSWRTCRHFGYDPATAFILPPPIHWPQGVASGLTNGNAVMRFVAAALFVGWKNLHLIVAAFDQICRARQNAELHLYGRSSKPADPPCQNQLIACAQRNPAIHLMDWQANWTRRLTASDVFVHAATEEPFGIVMLEAFAQGCQMVVPARTFFEDLEPAPHLGITIADPYDTNAFSKAMQQAVNEAQRVSSHSLWKTRLHFAEQFSVSHCQGRLTELYCQLAQLSPRTHRSCLEQNMPVV